MSFVWTVLRATAILGGLMAALVTGGIAHADTTPSVPGIGDLGTAVANAPQLLQNFGSALGVLPPQVLPAPRPLAGASITMPQAATGAVPGVPGAPAPAMAPSPGIPGLPLTIPGASAAAPQAPSAVPGAAAPGALPSAHVDVPQLPFLPVPLPQQLSLPGDLSSLAPGGARAPGGVATGPAVAAPAAAPTAPINPVLVPLSALP